jgi:hypothetical protein
VRGSDGERGFAEPVSQGQVTLHHPSDRPIPLEHFVAFCVRVSPLLSHEVSEVYLVRTLGATNMTRESRVLLLAIEHIYVNFQVPEFSGVR